MGSSPFNMPGNKRTKKTKTPLKAKRRVNITKTQLKPKGIGVNKFEENKNVAKAKHGSLYNPLHIHNDKRKDAIDHVYIEKDYHSGGKYIRQLNSKTGKTAGFFYENAKGHVFYQRYEPEPRTFSYHNKKTGRKTTINLRTGEKRTEFLDPNAKIADKRENDPVAPLLLKPTECSDFSCQIPEPTTVPEKMTA